MFGETLENEIQVRNGFGNFFRACLTIFQLLAGDAWNDVLYDSMSSKKNVFSQFLVAVFITVWWVVAQVVIKNLFVAAIIEVSGDVWLQRAHELVSVHGGVVNFF
jgi:hypothetical protein